MLEATGRVVEPDAEVRSAMSERRTRQSNAARLLWRNAPVLLIAAIASLAGGRLALAEGPLRVAATKTSAVFDVAPVTARELEESRGEGLEGSRAGNMDTAVILWDEVKSRHQTGASSQSQSTSRGVRSTLSGQLF